MEMEPLSDPLAIEAVTWVARCMHWQRLSLKKLEHNNEFEPNAARACVNGSACVLCGVARVHFGSACRASAGHATHTVQSRDTILSDTIRRRNSEKVGQGGSVFS
eukprot:15474908-Alexandrium_andersonii.AAC.1